MSRRILVVDDNVDSASMLETLLSITGHEARSAYNGAEAIALAATFLPEIVFLDVRLPDMNGFELARRLRVTPGLERAVMIAMSGYSDEQAKRSAREAGIEHYLVKPVDFAAMQRILAEPAR